MAKRSYEEFREEANRLAKRLLLTTMDIDQYVVAQALVKALRMHMLAMVTACLHRSGEAKARELVGDLQKMLNLMAKELGEFDYKLLLADVNSVFGSSLFNDIIKD